ncbi:DUF3103 family protein [Streptomyces sp. NPDC002306]
MENDAARAIASSLSDSLWRARVQKEALVSHDVAVTSLAQHASASLKSTLASADRRIVAAKGLDANVGSVLRLRLGADSMRAALIAGATPWVAAATAEDNPRTVTAYDSQGHTHTLDVDEVPTQPVYVVDIDAAKTVAAGLKVLNDDLKRQGLNSPAVARSKASAATPGFWTTRITQVRLSDDEESWIKGDAEIYTLVTGFGQNGQVRVDSVDMPYLDNENTTYQPDQILVNWANYKYNLADAVMMEDDGSTNYRELAKAIATALLTISDAGVYIPLANVVLDAMPDDWWTDNPDYVDSWYTLARSENGIRYGARGNGWMALEPYFVQQF